VGHCWQTSGSGTVNTAVTFGVRRTPDSNDYATNVSGTVQALTVQKSLANPNVNLTLSGSGLAEED